MKREGKVEQNIILKNKHEYKNSSGDDVKSTTAPSVHPVTEFKNANGDK